MMTPGLRCSLMALRCAIILLLDSIEGPTFEGMRRPAIQLLGALEEALGLDRTFPTRTERRAARLE